MRRTFGALTAALGLAALFGAGGGAACFDRSCESSPPILFGKNDGEGHLVADDTWESAALDASWLEYKPSSGYTFCVPAWANAGRPIVEVHAYISESPQPGASGNYTEGSGNAVEFALVKPGKLYVSNATCAHFWIRVVMKSGPPVPGAAAPTGNPCWQ